MIYINDIPSLRDPESSNLTFDERVEKIELINGNCVQDYGHVESGDIISLTCLFSVANYRRLKILWTNRTPVTFTDEAGDIWQDMWLVFKSIKRQAKFPDYVVLTFELWRI